MMVSAQITEQVNVIETIMLEKFRSEPFHNFHLLFKAVPSVFNDGGTCSDKTQSFIKAARQAGFSASLHSAFIGGREIHRLARVHIGKQMFFADIGNGWPALKLYPADREIHYTAFGMRFRTEVNSSRVVVFHTRNNKETCQVEIELRQRPENEIEADIAKRFTSGIEYPFSRSLRFSQIVNDRFLFIRGDNLEIYGSGSFEMINGITSSNLPAILRDYFGYNLPGAAQFS